MKIYGISTTYQNKPLIRFLGGKSPCPERIYEPDPKDQAIRDKLREWHYDNLIPTIIHSEENPLTTGQETKALLDVIFNIRKYGYGYLIKPSELPDYKNSYQGISLVDDKENLEKVKKYGIKTIIDLEYGDNYGDLVKSYGMKYISCPFDSIFVFYNWEEMEEEEDNEDENKEIYLNSIIDTINAMREGDFYISCSVGQERTYDFLRIIELLNPDIPKNNVYSIQAGILADNILNAMTPEHKKKLKWSEEDEEFVRDKINKALINI